MIKLRALLSLLCRGTQVAIRGRFAKPLGWVSRCAGSNPALDAKYGRVSRAASRPVLKTVGTFAGMGIDTSVVRHT